MEINEWMNGLNEPLNSTLHQLCKQLQTDHSVLLHALSNSNASTNTSTINTSSDITQLINTSNHVHDAVQYTILHQSTQHNIDKLHDSICNSSSLINDFISSLSVDEHLLYDTISECDVILCSKPIDINSVLLHSEKLATMSYQPVDHIERRGFGSALPPSIQDYEFAQSLLRQQYNIQSIQQLINTHQQSDQNTDEHYNDEINNYTTSVNDTSEVNATVHRPPTTRITIDDLGLDL